MLCKEADVSAQLFFGLFGLAILKLKIEPTSISIKKIVIFLHH